MQDNLIKDNCNENQYNELIKEEIMAVANHVIASTYNSFAHYDLASNHYKNLYN